MENNPVRPTLQDYREFTRLDCPQVNGIKLRDGSHAERGDVVEFTALGRIVHLESDFVSLIYENPKLLTQATVRVHVDQLTHKVGLNPEIGEDMHHQTDKETAPVQLGKVVAIHSDHLVIDGIDNEIYVVSMQDTRRFCAGVLCCRRCYSLTALLSSYIQHTE